MNSETSSANEEESLRPEASNDTPRCAYLPKGDVMIKKKKTVIVGGLEHTVTVDETVNQAIIEAANITIRKAFSRQRPWDPEDIVPELMRQVPFMNFQESYIRGRALKAWKDLNRKLDERHEKQSNGLYDESTKTLNPQLASMLGELETLQVMLSELKEIIEVKKLEDNSKRPTIITRNEKKTISKPNVATSFLKPRFGKQEDQSKTVSLLKPQQKGTTRMQGKSKTMSLLKPQDRGAKRMKNSEVSDAEETGGGHFGDFEIQHENKRGEPRKGHDDVPVEDHIRQKKEAIEKGRFLRQRATYGASNTDSGTDSSAVEKKEHAVSETPDTDLDELGFSIRKFQATMDRSNQLSERELVLKERMMGIKEASVGAGSGVGMNEVNLGASGSGVGRIHEANLGASRSGRAPSGTSDTSVDNRLNALEGQMALLLQKMDDLKSERGAGRQ